VTRDIQKENEREFSEECSRRLGRPLRVNPRQEKLLILFSNCAVNRLEWR
jgi:hypothetical protein